MCQRCPKKTGADPLSCRRQQLSPRSLYFLFYSILFFWFSIFQFLFLLHRAPLLQHPIRSSCWPPLLGQCWGSFSGTRISLLYTTHFPSHYSYSLQPLCYNNASTSLTSPAFFLPSVFFSSYNSHHSHPQSYPTSPPLSIRSFEWITEREGYLFCPTLLRRDHKPRFLDTTGIEPLSIQQDMQHLTAITFP